MNGKVLLASIGWCRCGGDADPINLPGRRVLRKLHDALDRDDDARGSKLLPLSSASVAHFAGAEKKPRV